MNILSIRGVLEQGACLDALISVMLDSSANQMVMLSFRQHMEIRLYDAFVLVLCSPVCIILCCSFNHCVALTFLEFTLYTRFETL